jgi:hypothetical protein
VVRCSPSPRATPELPDEPGNPTTACQRDVRRAARSYVEKKLKTLEKCGGAASLCVQRKPNDPKCLPSVRTRCATILGKLADAEAKLIAAVIKRCAGLSSSEVLGDDGLSYGDLANSCAVRFGRTLSDLTSVAQCLAAQHSCRAETLFARECPRAGELLRLADAVPDVGACREDFGGSGLGVGDPKGSARRSSAACRRWCTAGRVSPAPDSRPSAAASTAFSSASRRRTARRVPREGDAEVRARVRPRAARGRQAHRGDRQALQWHRLRRLERARRRDLDAVTPACASYDIPTVSTLADCVACLVRQHECDVADLVRFESPRGGHAGTGRADARRR